MSAQSRYRLANRAMWASWGLFFALVVYGTIYGPFRLHREPLFTSGFFLMLALMVLTFWSANKARKTVHCGKCNHRFFDGLFVLFPVKKGCSKCDAPLEHAYLYSGED